MTLPRSLLVKGPKWEQTQVYFIAISSALIPIPHLGLYSVITALSSIAFFLDNFNATTFIFIDRIPTTSWPLDWFNCPSQHAHIILRSEMTQGAHSPPGTGSGNFVTRCDDACELIFTFPLHRAYLRGGLFSCNSKLDWSSNWKNLISEIRLKSLHYSIWKDKHGKYRIKMHRWMRGGRMCWWDLCWFAVIQHENENHFKRIRWIHEWWINKSC